MLKKSNLIQIFIMLFAVGVFTQCNAQHKETVPKSTATTGGSIVRAADEAKIEVIVPDYEIKEKSLEYLQLLPMPEFNFVFESKSIDNNELPEDVKITLNAHWKESIKFFHETYLNKVADGQTAYKKDTAWLRYCNSTKNKLQQIIIEAPNGKRKISQTEASELYASLNKASVSVMDKAKSIK